MVTSCVVVMVHASRLFASPPSNAMSELLVCIIALIAVGLFLRDMNACNLVNGVWKFSLILLVANSIPILFNYSVPADTPEAEEEGSM